LRWQVHKGARFDVAAGGAVIGTINDTNSTFDLGDRHFVIASRGVFGPTRELKCGAETIAVATRRPLLNYYTLLFAGKEWTYKATTMLANKFGLFENETQVGTVRSGPWINRTKNMTADLPDQLPPEVQLFLFALFISQLTGD
jgi:hypothetical protein